MRLRKNPEWLWHPWETEDAQDSGRRAAAAEYSPRQGTELEEQDYQALRAHMTLPQALDQRFSTFLTLRSFNTVPQAVVTHPSRKITSSLLHNYNFVVMNQNVNI